MEGTGTFSVVVSLGMLRTLVFGKRRHAVRHFFSTNNDIQSLIFISNIVPIFVFLFVDLLQVAITILWLARAARKRGYQGPVLDSSFFHHLLPVGIVFF